MSASFDRRAFLQRAGIASAAAVTLTGVAARPPARADETLEPFPYGVASGDPLADRVILWTRVTPDDPTAAMVVSWRVFADADATQLVASGDVTTDASRDFTVKVDPTGLQPATWYWFAFETADGRTSMVGRTKTAPAGPTGRLRFGVASCSNYEGGYFNAYARMAERDDLDAVLHLGDYLYEYGQGYYGPGPEIGRGHQPPVEMVTLAQYRGRHAHYKLDPDLRRLHQKFPFIVTWDDHEITNDSWKDGAQNHQDDEGDYELRKQHAAQAYAEWMPIRLPDPTDPVKIWRSFAYGDLVDLIVMDTRIDGRDEVVGGAANPDNFFQPDLESEDRRMISQAQLDWLKAGLSGSRATWKVLAQQVMMMPWKAAGTPAALGQGPDTPALTSGGLPINADAWDGYPAERARVLGHIAQGAIDNVVVLTGDIHSSWAADLPLDPFTPGAGYNPVDGAGSLAVEFVCPSVTSKSFNKTLGYYPQRSHAAENSTKAANPHIKYTEFDSHGYMLLDVTADRFQCQWWHAHDVFEPNDNHVMHAAWETRTGENRVVEAAEVAEPREVPDDVRREPPSEAPSVQGVTLEQDAPPAAPVGDAVGEDTTSLPATGGGAVAAGLAAMGVAGLLHLRSRQDRRDEV